MPETLDYMIAGYILGFVVLAILVGNIWLRWQGIRKDAAALAELEAEVAADDGAHARQAASAPSDQRGSERAEREALEAS